MNQIATFLAACDKVRRTGSAVPETSYYPALDTFLSAVGGALSPPVYSVTHVSGVGGPGSTNTGIPDMGLFCDVDGGQKLSENLVYGERLPERGVVEVKPPSVNLDKTVASAQVRKYLDRYGKVLVTNLRDWRLLVRGSSGMRVLQARIELAADEASFWGLATKPSRLGTAAAADFEAFLLEALEGESSIARVDDLARFMGAQAKRALALLDGAEVKPLDDLRTSMEEGLGMQFNGEDGEHFFKSTLIQSLFYGMFSAWVLSHRAGNDPDEFHWNSSHWHLRLPVVIALFGEIAHPTNLKPLGLVPILDGALATLRRVDTERFFEEFDEGYAVQYFYEPFISYFDPELRAEYGIWYTPPEVVDYMVEHVDEALRTKLGRPKGLADENVWVLDPCVGTGSFLLAVAKKIQESLPDDDLAAQDLKRAVTKRLVGFELLPAPFVVSHLQMGLFLSTAGAPLQDDERSAVYLTNSLVGWTEAEAAVLPLREFEEERQAAADIKQQAPILVVIGNPPYNGYAGVATEEESDLVAPYRESITTKNSLADLYVRFFRIAERQIAERSGEGLICYISNFSYLHEPGFMSMRQHLRDSFDEIYIDNLNGDSRETGKQTPDGGPDPSVFSTRFNRAGIQAGTAIGTFIRTVSDDFSGPASVHLREFWGKEKHAELQKLVDSGQTFGDYSPVSIRSFNRGSFRPTTLADDYESWTSVRDLADFVELGLNENRGSSLIDPSRDEIVKRMDRYFDPKFTAKHLATTATGPMVKKFSGFDPVLTRKTLFAKGFDESKVGQIMSGPLDCQWAYLEPDAKLWNRSRPDLLRNHIDGDELLLLRNRAPRAKDGVPVLPSTVVGNQHAMHKDAYHIPFHVRTEASAAGGMFADEKRPNLSSIATAYLNELGIASTDEVYASVIWHHALSITSSPAYEAENSGGIAADWPRVPLPRDADSLRASAVLGRTIGSLLDPRRTPLTSLPGVASIRSTRTSKAIDPTQGDLEVRAGWSILQQGNKVMPSSGLLEARSATTSERAEFNADEVVDVYLNEHTYWAGVPRAVWDLKIGGYQVLKKWLSYREHGPDSPSPLLGRSLTVDEAREFTDIVRRLAGFLALGGVLDTNYALIRSSQ